MSRRRVLVSASAALCFSLAASPALALKQPDGTTIPQTNNLKNVLAGEGDGAIDPVAAAATTPQTFDPACSLTFKVIGRGAGQKNSFGWYNATGSKPAATDLHEFLTCNDDVGTVKTLAIKSDPAYKGGKIGFFMATTEGAQGNCVQFGPTGPTPATLGHLYYSESQYNDDNQGANSYIHLILFDSQKFPKAFYFGWEDLFGGGDNDFEDILTRVEGITCAGGGVACDVPGKMGLCTTGVKQCKNGTLECLPLTQASPEKCNGIDDDCNGKVDDGDKLCQTGFVCFQGNCVAGCGNGEFVCPPGFACDSKSGYCIDAACVGKTCPMGSVCKAGQCVAPCMGVTCPVGQVCRNDACVDPCVGITCDGGTICEDGVCKDKCGCGNCPNGKACATSGKCVDTGCETQTCMPGSACVGGKCVDACSGAKCPLGQACKDGKCIVASGTGGAAGSAGAGGGTGGAAGGGTGGKSGAAGAKAGSAGAAGKAGTGGTGGAAGISVSGPENADATDDGDSGGCGCRAAGESRSLAGALGLAVAFFVALRRRVGGRSRVR